MNTKDKTPIILEKIQWISSIFGKRAYEQRQVTLNFEGKEGKRNYAVMALLPELTYKEQKKKKVHMLTLWMLNSRISITL